MLWAEHVELPTAAVRSEESQWILVIRHQDILGMAIMIQHHLVVLPPDAGFLVPAKGSASRVGVVTITPDTSGLNATGEGLHLVHIAGPYAGAQSV